MLPLAIALLVVCESALSCVVGYRNFRSTALYNDHGIQKEYTLFHYGAEDLAAESGLQWLVTHAAPRAIVVVSMPHWVYLKTGLKSIMAPLDTGPQKTERLIDAVPATYVILDQFLFFNKQLPVAVRNFPEKWRLVYASPGANFDIYQRMGFNPTQQVAPIQPSSRSLRF